MILCVTLWGAATVDAQSLRPYQDGPLQASDFRRAPPANRLHKAYTSTRMAHNSRYQVKTRNGVSTIRLVSIEMTNDVEQSNSWNATPQDAQLLSHEQGHFDITEVMRRRAASYWEKRLPSMVFRASSPSKCQEALKVDGRLVS